MKRLGQERIVFWPGAFLLPDSVRGTERVFFKGEEKRKENTLMTSRHCLSPGCKSSLYWLNFRSLWPQAVYSATYAHFRNKGDGWTQKTEKRKRKEGGRRVSGCKSSHMCLAAAAGRGSTGVRPKAAALIKFPWSLVNLRSEWGWQGTAGAAKCLQRCCRATGKNTHHLCSYC